MATSRRAANAPRLARFIAALTLGCGSTERPRFTDGDASTAPPDRVASSTCRSNGDCDDRVACTMDLCAVGGVCEHVPTGAECVTSRRCMRASDCDDNVACTRDRCLVEGVCGNTPQNDLCAAGQTCDLSRGCTGGAPPPPPPPTPPPPSPPPPAPPPPPPPPPPRCMNDGDCDDRMRCTGVERCFSGACAAGTPVRCDDMNACTTDACVESGASMCAYTAVPGCTMVTPRAGSYTLTPRVAYACQDEVFKTPILNVSVTSIRFTATSTAVTVTWMGAPATLMGGPMVGNAFRVTANVPNEDCPSVLTLSGTFVDERRFTGAFEFRFAGIGCALTGCENQRYMVAGAFVM